MAAAPTWNTYAIRPLGFTGACLIASWIVPDPSDTLLAACVLVGTGTPSGVNDPAFTRLNLELHTDGNGFDYFDQLPGTAGLTFAFFSETQALGWVTGPSRTVSLVDDIQDPSFPYFKPWIVQNLQASAAIMAPLGPSKPIHVRGAFPRDTHPKPCISVQASATPLNEQVIGDLKRALGAFNSSPQSLELGRQWSLQFSIVLWTDSPEIRDQLVPWFGSALARLVELAPFQGLVQPVYSIEETEDFSGSVSETPLFIASASLSGLAWSSLKVPIRNWIGFITV